MDWNLKTSSWDFAEFGQEHIPNLDPRGLSRGDFSVDLKLGQVANSSTSDLGDNFKVPAVPKTALSPPSGSSKRGRSAVSGIQAASCLVDGCNADLNNCREYHRRHKVCEAHSKTPEVSIAGHKKRFCQQCSRFHSLEEFDEGKRSCRKRLDGHNRRRRKPQPEPGSRVGNLMSPYQGARLLSFSSSQVYPTTTVSSPIWGGSIKVEEDYKPQLPQNPFFGSTTTTTTSSSSSGGNGGGGGGGRQFSFLHGPGLALGNQTMPMEDSGMLGRSECALSLLSSPPPPPPMMMQQPISVPLPGPGPGLSFGGLEAVDSILVPNVHGQGMFDARPEASSDNETPQTLPFYWE